MVLLFVFKDTWLLSECPQTDIVDKTIFAEFQLFRLIEQLFDLR